jgi:hypothetical protein
MNKKSAEQLAKALAPACVRNGFIEELHCGKGAYSHAGDYSDVTVVTPDREIPWHELSRISDEEMKRLMKEIVNKTSSTPCFSIWKTRTSWLPF